MENTWLEMKKIRIIKMITTGMDLAGLVACLFALVPGLIFLIKFGRDLSSLVDWLGKGEYDELVGGYEILFRLLALGGTLFGVIALGLLIGVAVLLLLTFLVPSVHGVVLLANGKKYENAGIGIYKKSAQRDSVIKLIFNGIPCVFLVGEIVNDIHNITAIEVLVWVYFALICALEIYSLVLLRKEM